MLGIRRKPEESEPEKKEEMNPTLKNVDIFNIPETELTGRIKLVATPELRERYRSLNKFNRKFTPEPMSTPTETRQRHDKLVRAIRILGREIDLRERREREAALQASLTWRNETVPAQLPNMRICRDATLLKDGLADISASRWETPTSTTLTLTTSEGFEQTFDLLQIPPDLLRRILAAPFHPAFIPYGGTSKAGKPHGGGWVNGKDFDEVIKVKVRPLRYWALMKV